MNNTAIVAFPCRYFAGRDEVGSGFNYWSYLCNHAGSVVELNQQKLMRHGISSKRKMIFFATGIWNGRWNLAVIQKATWRKDHSLQCRDSVYGDHAGTKGAHAHKRKVTQIRRILEEPVDYLMCMGMSRLSPDTWCWGKKDWACGVSTPGPLVLKGVEASELLDQPVHEISVKRLGLDQISPNFTNRPKSHVYHMYRSPKTPV